MGNTRLYRAGLLGIAVLAAGTAHACEGTTNCANGLAYQNFGPATAPVLAVFLHGDVSAGGPADYMVSHARSFAAGRKNVVAVALLRPGYYDRNGAKSAGPDNGRRDGYGSGNVRTVANAISELKTKFKANKVVVLGHSGGAAIAGVILGSYGTINGAVLAACACDISSWRGNWSSLSAINYVGGIPAGAPVVAVTGSGDTNTIPKIAEDYIAKAQAAGKNAKVQIVGGGHNFGGGLAGASVAALGSMAR